MTDIENYDSRQFMEFSSLLGRFISDLDVYVVNCDVCRKTGDLLPSHHLKNFALHLLICFNEKDVAEYIARWQLQIIVCESDSSAIAEYEFPNLENTLDPQECFRLAHPTAHGYAATLLSTVAPFLLSEIVDDPWKNVVPIFSERLSMIRFSDLNTLSRVSARMWRERAIFAKANELESKLENISNSQPRNSSELNRRRQSKEINIECVMTVLIDHHKPEGDWCDEPMSQKQIMEKSQLGSESTVTRTIQAIFGEGGMETYKAEIRDKTLFSRLVAKLRDDELPLQGFFGLNEQDVVDPSSVEENSYDKDENDKLDN